MVFLSPPPVPLKGERRKKGVPWRAHSIDVRPLPVPPPGEGGEEGIPRKYPCGLFCPPAQCPRARAPDMPATGISRACGTSPLRWIFRAANRLVCLRVASDMPPTCLPPHEFSCPGSGRRPPAPACSPRASPPRPPPRRAKEKPRACGAPEMSYE